ncbi:hypothetical protein [uncultured Vagococcus sp.]|uniref:hypothetical protein n=1 Tax=uncultured Vagococcus sp. TaxID=189676 RepID=UPI00258B3391|nr:hypothetical protein [uncultured Vagococcus sp.]
MKDYLWIFILGAIVLLSAGLFLGTISKSSILINRLKLPKGHLILNFTLLAVSLVDIGLIVYVFLLVRDQITALT